MGGARRNQQEETHLEVILFLFNEFQIYHCIILRLDHRFYEPQQPGSQVSSMPRNSKHSRA